MSEYITTGRNIQPVHPYAVSEFDSIAVIYEPVGDARNNTPLFIFQLHLAFLHFHNRIVDQLRREGVQADTVFHRAAQMVRWHYQWIVLHEFLRLTVGNDPVDELLDSGAKYAGSREDHSFRLNSLMAPTALVMLRFVDITM